ncbi:MAG: Gfo/Idh/MocA family protein [Bacillota bacterium]
MIGCGEIAQIMHLHFLSDLKDMFEVTAVCDISRQTVNQIGSNFGVRKRFTNYRDLLSQDDVDVVAVLTFDHIDIACDGAAAGKHLFIEKPLCFNLEECDRLLEASKKHGVKVMVGYMKRYDPAYEYAQPMFSQLEDVKLVRVHDLASGVRDGSLIPLRDIYTLYRFQDVSREEFAALRGKTRQAMAEAIGSNEEERINAYSMLLGLASHDCSILRGAFGDPEEILFTDIYQGGRYLISVLRYPNDVRCVWEVGGFDVKKSWWDEELAAFGSEKMIAVRFPNPYIRYAPTIVAIKELDGQAEVEKQVIASYDEAFRREWKHFYECIVSNKEPRTTAEDAKEDIKLLADIIKAAK